MGRVHLQQNIQPLSEKNSGYSKPSLAPKTVNQPGFSWKIKKQKTEEYNNQSGTWNTWYGKKKTNDNKQSPQGLTNYQCHNPHRPSPKDGNSQRSAENHWDSRLKKGSCEENRHWASNVPQSVAIDGYMSFNNNHKHSQLPSLSHMPISRWGCFQTLRRDARW